MIENIGYWVAGLVVVAGVPALLSVLIETHVDHLFRGLDRQPRLHGLQAPYLLLAAILAAVAGAFATSFAQVNGELTITVGLLTVLALVLGFVNVGVFLRCMKPLRELLKEGELLEQAGLPEESGLASMIYTSSLNRTCRFQNQCGHIALALSLGIIVGGVWIV